MFNIKGTGVASYGTGKGTMSYKGSGNNSNSTKVRSRFNGDGNIDYSGSGNSKNPSPGHEGILASSSSAVGSNGVSTVVHMN